MEEHASHAAPEGGEAHEVHHGSIWPFVLAVAGGLGFSGVATHEFVLIIAGIAVLVVGVGGWLWQDAQGVSFSVKGEFEERPFVGISRRKLGMWIFLVSEIFFFTGLIGAGLTLRLRVPACPALGQACWPVPGTAEFPLNIPLTALNTFILITSSLTMVEALHAAQKGNRAHMKAFLLATFLLGATFVSIQVYEYNKLFFEENLSPWVNSVRPELGTFGTAFYAQTGFHGAHVTGGIIALLFLTVAAFRGKYGKDDHEAIELVGLYWHFVDVVWIFLFPIMYLIGR